MKNILFCLGPVSESQALIITAIISLIGVLVGVILNYRSNIKLNYSRTTTLDKRAKLSYLREVLNILNEARKDVNEHDLFVDLSKGQKSIDAAKKKIIESNAYALGKLKEVEPFLMKADRDRLMSRYKNIEKRRGELQVKGVGMGDFSDTDYNLFKGLILDEIELKSEFKRVLDEEMTIISDAIRNQIDIW